MHLHMVDAEIPARTESHSGTVGRSEKQASPWFSVLIPVWRGDAWIERAIRSVIGQTYPHWDLIVGDNASDDSTIALAMRHAGPRVLVQRWPNHVPIFDNFDRTLTLATGDWVYLLPVDDALEAHCLERMAEVIRSHSGTRPLVAVWPRAARVDSTGQRVEAQYYGFQGEAKVAGGTYGASEWLDVVTRPGSPPWDGGAFHRATIDAMGVFFRSDVPSMSADLELAVRIAAWGDVAFVDEPLLMVTGLGESDTPARISRNLASGETFTTRGMALAEGLRAHEAKRAVSDGERRRVRGAIARTHLRRAVAHRYVKGGRGRRGSLEDLVTAIRLSPRIVLWSGLPRSVLALLLPTTLILSLRRLILDRRGRTGHRIAER